MIPMNCEYILGYGGDYPGDGVRRSVSMFGKLGSFGCHPVGLPLMWADTFL